MIENKMKMQTLKSVKWNLFAVGLIALGIGSFATVLWAEESESVWPRFRGPNGSGFVADARAPIRWTAKDYNWKVELPGKGHSSPIVWNDKIFVTSGDEETALRRLLCINAADGRQLWRREYAVQTHRKHKLNSFASCTPAVDRERVFFIWAAPEEFVVMALDHQGKELWRRDLGPYKASYGNGVSLIVHQDLLIIPNEQQGDSTLVALDVKTGATRWKINRNSNVSYSTPCVRPAGNGQSEIIFTNWKDGMTAVNPQTGRINWQADFFDKGHTESAIGSPVLAGDLVLGVCGWLGYGKEVIALSVDSVEGKPTPKQQYRITRGAPLCTTPLVAGKLLFLWSDEGIVVCADALTGKTYWRKRVGGKYYASPICIGESVYNISTDGEVFVLKRSRQYRLLARNKLELPSHSTPAFAGGTLYFRTFSHLISIGSRQSGAAAISR